MSKEKDMSKKQDEKAPDSEDTIEIASPGEALTSQFAQELSSAHASGGQSNSPVKKEETQSQAPPSQQTTDSKSDIPVKRLSSEQVQSIASRFSAEDAVASKNDREQLIKSLGSEDDDLNKRVTSETTRSSATGVSIPVSTSVPSSSPTPKKTPATSVSPIKTAPGSHQSSGPARGVARYSGRTITLGASEQMHSGDNLVVNGNHYQLKPGKAKSNFLGLAISAVLIISSAFAGKYFLSSNLERGGEIIGVAIGQNGLPYSDGAIVRIPELGISTVTDSQGLFHFPNLPDGKHKLEYNLAGSLGGSRLISVSPGEAIMISLDGATKRLAQTVIQSPNQSSSTHTSSKRNSPAKTKQPKVSASTKGSLAVTSDISGAIVYIDNQKLGTVNRTFRRMNSGKRTIRIEKPGYEPYKAKVTIKANKIAKVNVSLVPTQTEQEATTPKELSASELYEKARAAFDGGSIDEAQRYLNETLEKDPSFAEAYFMRGESLARSGNTAEASLDYIRAGEIWSRQKRNQDALSAFDKAVEISNGSAVAYKVRGDFFVNSKKRARGIEDFKRSVDADKNYYDAHLALGVALFKSGSYRHADKELRRAKDFNDKDPVLYQYLMLNSLAKNNLSDVNRYFKQFKKKATPAQLARFRSNDDLAAIRRIVKD